MEDLQQVPTKSRRVLFLAVAAIQASLTFIMMMMVSGVIQCFRTCYKCCGVKCSVLDPVFYEDWFSFNIGLPALRAMTSDRYLNLTCTIRQGSQAPDMDLHTLDGVCTRLTDLQRAGRPLIINFGSCS